ncbi:OmpA family protein [Shewanella sp. OMA3-2]|uniref:OmpA family protein n=1 Tax=Shewanella sp. OMA3-2 TaxID=2908650 RepID=UPI001F3C1416|nr:OmpA family protein [Shewanella sp. OMA3-2]UJF21252.1 OmpA family protein [Shewanella sp. OMA3-2]
MRLFITIQILCFFLLSSPALAWVDTDMDGVPDKKDACADTPKGVEVMANGCKDPALVLTELNSDEAPTIEAPTTAVADELINTIEYVNRCEQLGTNDVVNCLQQVIQPIYFEFAKAEVMLSQRPVLDSIHNIIAQNNNVTLQLVGHADLLGSDALNQALSLARANSVKAILVTDFNFNPDNIFVKGMSNTQPAADNATSEGRQRNRRVEFIISAE